jgi:polygalacturonase
MNNLRRIFISIFFLLAVVWNINGVNVKDFGAIGDGVNDDTKFIKEAILRADDGLIVFPRGKYRITESIEIDLKKNW